MGASFALTGEPYFLPINHAGRDTHGDGSGASYRTGAAAIRAGVGDDFAGAIAVWAGCREREGTPVFGDMSGAVAIFAGAGGAGAGPGAVAGGAGGVAGELDR